METISKEQIKREYAAYEVINFEEFTKIWDWKIFDAIRVWFAGKVVALKSCNNERTEYRLILFSEKYRYEIMFLPESNYIGSMLYCRAERPFETWHRMSDYPDGKFTEETLADVVTAIASGDLISLKVVDKEKGNKEFQEQETVVK